jgi:hypothetical protein
MNNNKKNKEKFTQSIKNTRRRLQTTRATKKKILGASE